MEIGGWVKITDWCTNPCGVSSEEWIALTESRETVAEEYEETFEGETLFLFRVAVDLFLASRVLFELANARAAPGVRARCLLFGPVFVYVLLPVSFCERI